MAVFGVYFQHLYTSVNGVGKHDINIRGSSSAIPLVAHLCSLQERSDDTRRVAAPAVHRFLLIAGIGFVFCPTSGRYWRKSLSAIVLLLSSLALFFAFLVPHSRVCPRLKSGLPRSAELPSVIVPTFGASRYFGKSIPFAAATESRTTGAIVFPRSDRRYDAAAAEAPAGLSFLSPHPNFQRTAATGGDTPPSLSMQQVRADRAALGDLNLAFCDSPPRSSHSG